MIFSWLEFLHIIITIFILGIIFSRELSKESILFGMKVAGLSIIAHELAHKIAALLLGYEAFYKVNLFGLMLGLFFKVIGSPTIFFIPGYVNIIGIKKYLDLSIIAIAGPATNFIFYILGKRLYRIYSKDEYLYFSNLNFWLFILNMLPLPPLDGFKVVYGIYKTLLG